jgi:Xaa-Pro aminopeptidase
MREFIAKIKPAFERYKNIGVRIEDDMLVTATGTEWMTGKLPRSIAAIEEFMKRNSKKELKYGLLQSEESAPAYAYFALGD